MTGRRAARVAWVVATISIGVTAVTVAMRLDIGPIPFSEAPAGLLDLIPQVLFAISGAIVSAHQPRNPIGWILGAMALVWAVEAASGYYALYAFDELTWLPGGDFASVFHSIAWAVPILGLPAIFALFPTGRLPSARWSWILFGLLVPSGLTVALAVLALPHGGRTMLLDLENVEMVAGTDALIGAFLLSVVLLVAGGVASLIVRFRRGGPTERNQIKFLILAGIGLVASAATSNLLKLPVLLSDLFSLATFAAVPVAIGAAILRYGLYDIDRVINKTIVYGLVSAVLLAGYAGGVLVLGSVLQFGNESPFVTAGATLAMAGLFGPLRRTIQSAVDRRFYRHRYDSIRTIEEFSRRLRTETDLGVLTDDLVGVVQTTMQPAHASLWIRRAEIPMSLPRDSLVEK